MNNSEFNKIDWINIVNFKIFQDCFNLKALQDLSMLSKHTRSKLNPILFKSIQIITERKFIDGYVVKNFNSKACTDLNNILNSDEDEAQKNLSVQNSLSNINTEIRDIKYFANSLYIYDMKRSGYYLCQIITNFTNISILKIHCSTIPYSIFQKLGEYFPMLKIFDLYKTVLSKYLTDSNDSNEIILPPNLINLSIWHADVTDISILSDPYKTVFNNSSYDARTEYSLPKIHVPSLKNLQFLRCTSKDSGLEEFLEMNSNLEHLNIDTFSPEMSKSFTSLKSLNLEQVDMFENLQNLTVLHSIKTLKISIEDQYHYEKLEKICLMCPSIEFLRFSTSNFGYYGEVFSTYLVPTLKKLPNLKTLELSIDVEDRELELIDINQFPQIENIIFEADDLFYLKVCFEKNRNLKKIEFSASVCDIDKQDFLEKYGSYTEWEFKFHDSRVIGVKIK
jgi:hypothetical protein